MKIYCVIWADRHSDTTVHPFTNADKAISEARRVAKESCRYEDDYAEHDYGKADGWLFYAQYSCEGDHVRVVTTDLDKEI